MRGPLARVGGPWCFVGVFDQEMREFGRVWSSWELVGVITCLAFCGTCYVGVKPMRHVRHIL